MEKCEGIAEVEWKGEKHKINLDIAVGAEDFEWHARSDTDSQELNRIIKNPSTLTPGKVQAGDSKYWGTYRAEDIDGRSMEISLLQKGAVKFSEGGESIDGQGKWFTVMDSLFLKGPGGLDMILTINPDGSLRLVEVEVESGVWEDSWDYEALLKKI